MGSYCFISTVSVLQDGMCSGVHGRDGRTKLDDWRPFPQADSSLVTVPSDFNLNATPFSALPSAGPEGTLGNSMLVLQGSSFFHGTRQTVNSRTR